MTRLGWSAHLLVLTLVMSFGVVLFAQGSAGGLFYDILMYGVLCGIMVQLIVIVASSKTNALDHSKWANIWTFSIWFGISYPFILLRDTNIGLLFSLLVSIPGTLLGLITISVMRLLASKVPFGKLPFR